MAHRPVHLILTLLTQAIRKRKQQRKTRKKIAAVETAQMIQCLIAVVMKTRMKKVMSLMMRVIKMRKARVRSI